LFFFNPALSLLTVFQKALVPFLEAHILLNELQLEVIQSFFAFITARFRFVRAIRRF